MKKVVFAMSILCTVFLTGMDRIKGSFSPKKDSPREHQKTDSKRKKLSGSDTSAPSPKRIVNSMDEFKGELKKTKEERKQLEENK